MAVVMGKHEEHLYKSPGTRRARPVSLWKREYRGVAAGRDLVEMKAHAVNPPARAARATPFYKGGRQRYANLRWKRKRI
jgi:hypothetical protein